MINYQSQIMFDPDVVLEIFMFDRTAGPEEIKETAEAQLSDDGQGEATEDAAADIPADRNTE